MTKLMRKYQKWLLAILGSFLMVVFLVQGVMGSMNRDPGARAFGSIDGHTISINQRGVSDARYIILEKEFPGFLQQIGIEGEDHWLFLTYQAQKGGFTGYAGDGRDFMETLAQLQVSQYIQELLRSRGLTQENLQQILDPKFSQAQVANVLDKLQAVGAPEERPGMNTIRGFELALADLRGVTRMLTANMSSSQMSDRLAHLDLADLESEIVADAIVLNAEALIPSMPQPTDDELNAQFEKAKAVDASKAADGFGYIMPPRVKVEWIQIEKSALASAVKLDDVAVRKKWMQDRVTYPGEFAVEGPKVREALIEAEVQRLMGEADRALKSQVTLAIKDLPEADGFRTLPANWSTERPSLAAIALKVVEAVKNATGVTIPAPTVGSRDQWLTADALRLLPGIGSSGLRMGTSAASFPQLAMQVRELAPDHPFAAIQVGIPFMQAPLQNLVGDHFAFTILDAKPSAPAESLDEVREKVTHDVKAVKAFEKLRSNLDAFKALAVSEGLEAVGKMAVEGTSAAAPAPRLQVRIPKDPTRRNDPDLGPKEVSDPIWAAGGSLDPLVEQTKDTLAARTVAVAREDARKVVIAQVLQLKPLTLEAVRRLQPSRLVELRQREIRDVFGNGVVPSAYTEAALRQMLKYEPVDKERDKKRKK